MTSPTPRSAGGWKAALPWLIVLVASAVFTVRGPVRQLSGTSASHDFTMLWAGARAWTLGINPYDHEALLAEARQAGLPQYPWITPVQYLSLYPPTTYAALAPLGVLPWGAAKAAWAGINLLAIAALAWCVWRWWNAVAPIQWPRNIARNDPRGTPGNDYGGDPPGGAGAVSGGLTGEVPGEVPREIPGKIPGEGAGARLAWVLAMVFLWAPSHACLFLGNLSVVCAAAALWACSPMGRAKPITAAVVLGVITAIKPQFAGPLAVVWMIVIANRRAAVVLVGTGLALSAVGLVRMFMIDPSWVADLRENLLTFTHGGTADPSASNPNAFTMIDLPPLLHLFLDSRPVVKAITWTAAGLAFTAAVWGWWRRAERDHEAQRLTLFAAVATITLLPVYHRFYDATLLLIPAVWVLASLAPRAEGRRGAGAWLGALGLLPFLVAGTAAIYLAVAHGWLPRVLTDVPVLRALTLHHQTLAMLVLVGVLVGRLVWAGARDAKGER